jgi:hypothetical protein
MQLEHDGLVSSHFTCRFLQVLQPVLARVELRRVCLVRESRANLCTPPRDAAAPVEREEAAGRDDEALV